METKELTTDKAQLTRCKCDLMLAERERQKADRAQREACETLQELYEIVRGKVLLPRSMHNRINRQLRTLPRPS